MLLSCPSFTSQWFESSSRSFFAWEINVRNHHCLIWQRNDLKTHRVRRILSEGKKQTRKIYRERKEEVVRCQATRAEHKRIGREEQGKERECLSFCSVLCPGQKSWDWKEFKGIIIIIIIIANSIISVIYLQDILGPLSSHTSRAGYSPVHTIYLLFSCILLMMTEEEEGFSCTVISILFFPQLSNALSIHCL